MTIQDMGATITTRAGTVTEKQFAEMRSRPKTAEPPKKTMPVRCPFLRRECNSGCALYDGGCAIVTGGAGNPAGRCPIGGAGDSDMFQPMHCDRCTLFIAGRCFALRDGKS